MELYIIAQWKPDIQLNINNRFVWQFNGKGQYTSDGLHENPTTKDIELRDISFHRHREYFSQARLTFIC